MTKRWQLGHPIGHREESILVSQPPWRLLIWAIQNPPRAAARPSARLTLINSLTCEQNYVNLENPPVTDTFWFPGLQGGFYIVGNTNLTTRSRARAHVRRALAHLTDL